MAANANESGRGRQPLPKCARVGIGILIGTAVMFLIGFILCSIY